MPERDGDHDGQVGEGTPSAHVVLRDFADPSATRSAIFSKTLAAAQALPPVATKHHELSLSDVAFDGPENFSKERQKRAVLEGQTLERRLKGTFTLKDLATGEVLSKKTTTLAHVPYLTDDGTFIHKGSAYSLASQLRLRAGVYARRKGNGELESHVNTLPGAGRSHRIGLDPATGKFHIEVGQAKVPLTPALHALGATPSELAEAWGPEVAAANRRDDHAASLKRLHDKLVHPSAPPHTGDIAEGVRKEFARMKLDPEVTARTLGHPHEVVGKDALIAATKKLLAINRGEAEPDDRDHLAFMTAHGPEDLLAEKISRVKGPLHQALWRAARNGNLDNLAPGILSGAVRGAILDSGLGSPGEQINQAMVMDQIGRASRLGEGGIPSTDSIPPESRNVHPSQLGFIDTIWTPESISAGVDTRAASGVKKGSDGKLYAPFRDTKTGATTYMTPSDLAEKVVAFPNEMASGKATVSAIKGGKLVSVRRDQVDVEPPHFEHGYSPVMNMVPMKSSVKPQRSSMGGRFLTQALPLLDPEAPFVRSAMPENPGRSYEEEHGKAMGAVRAEKPGVIAKVEPGKIVVKHDDGTTVEHELHVHSPLNRKTGRHQTPMVRAGQRVGPNDLLARSNFTDEKGVTALGKNARVAYMAHGGYNFEDANVISESMAKRLSSDHYYQHELEHGDGVVTGRDPHTAIFPGVHDRSTLSTFDDEGVIKPGTQVSTGHPLILAAKQRDRSYGSMHAGRKASFSDATVTWDHHNPGMVTDVARTKKGTLVVVRSHAAAEIGDKISGRYGDKGIISRIVPDDQMPRGEDGRPFEALLNPLGIISRCYDDQTEFMTFDGWKLGIDVEPDALMLCYSPITGLPGLEGQFEWESIACPMHAAEYKGPMYCYDDKCVSFKVTPGHTFWIDRYFPINPSVLYDPEYPPTRHGHWEKLKVEEVTGIDCVVPCVLPGWKAKHDWSDRVSADTDETMTVLYAKNWRIELYDGLVFCPTVPTGLVPTRRNGKVQVAGNTNPAQMVEAALGKVAEKTGQPYAVRDFAGGDHLAFAKAELARHGLKDTETVHDPEHNRQIPGIFTGNRFIMKLHHSAESKAQGRGTGGYTAEGTPARGGEAGSKRISLMDSNALLSHGATAFLRDVAIRGQSSPRYWQQVMSGHTPPEPEVPQVYEKFHEMLRAAGLNPRRQGTRTHLLALTNKDVDELAGDRELKNAETVDWKAGMKPIAGGLMDPTLTGGSDGNRWSSLRLHEPMPNPAFEEPARRMLGLTRAKFLDVLAGRHEISGHGTGPQALVSALGAIKVDDAIDHARREIEAGRGASRDDAVRKLGYLKAAKEHGLHPRDWILDRVPVLPPRFRPVSVMQGGLPMVSDPNLLYKELHDANENLKAMSGQVEDLGDERLAVYNAFRGITGLGDPLHPKNREKQVSGQLRKIFGDSPKYGVVQRKLVGSSVDIVGRSVISPDPTLNIDQVGLPEGHAWTVYKPFVVRRLVRNGMDRLRAAKAVADKEPIARKALEDEVKVRPVVMGRAPTLHRYSLLGANPILMSGDTMRLNPLVTKGFGADFDGNCVIGATEISLQVDTDVLGSESADVLDTWERLAMRITGISLIGAVDTTKVMTIKIGDFPRSGEATIDRNGASVYAVPAGVGVLSYDHEAGTVGYEPVTHLTVDADHPCVRVETARGRDVEVSDNESLCVFDFETGGLAKIKPKNAGDAWIPVIKNEGVPGNWFDRDLGWWYASLASCGWTGRDTVGYAKVEGIKRAEFIRIAREQIFPDFSVREYIEKAGDNKLGDSVKIHLNGHDFRSHVLECCGEGDPDKRSALRKIIPPMILDCGSRACLLGALSGFFDGDGTLSWNTTMKKRRFVARISTSSIALAHDVRRLCRRLGVRAGISVSPANEERNEAYIVLPSIVDLYKVAAELTPVGEFEKASLAEFVAGPAPTKDNNDVIPVTESLARGMGKAIDYRKYVTLYSALCKGAKVGTLGRSTALRVANLLPDNFCHPHLTGFLRLINNHDVHWDRVESVTPIGHHEVFDLVVPTTKVFAVDSGLVVFDTMNFHVPASDDAVKDVYEKMMASKNLFAVSDFRAHQLPSQELVAGLHGASTAKSEGKRARTFATAHDAVRAWKRGELDVGDPVEIAGD